MQGTHFTISYHTAGTLAADHQFTFKMPFDAQLVYVSAVSSNASNAILDVGYVGATETYVKNMDVGDSLAPAVCDEPGDFEGDNYPHIAKDTIVEAYLDYDGASGTAAQNFTLLLVFSEG